MKKFLLFLIIISAIFTSSCYSYMDMNRVSFAIVSIIDKESDGTAVLYGENFVSDRGDSEQGGVVSRVVLKGKGKNTYDAFTNVQGSATYPISYDLLRAIGVTKSMAKSGIEEVVDLIERDQNVTNKLFLFICDADPEELLNIEMFDEKFTGIWLEDIFIFQKEEAKIISIRANDYLNERLKGIRISVLPIVDIATMPTEDRLSLSGAAIMQDDKMIGRLGPKEIPIYKILFLKEKNIIGAFTIEYPETEAEIVFSILGLKTNEKLEFVDDELTLTYDIKLNLSIQTVIGNLDLSEGHTRDSLIKVAEETMKKRCEEFYEKYQETGIDILDVKLKLDRKYPQNEFDDGIFRSVNIKVNPTVRLDGSQDITDTLD